MAECALQGWPAWRKVWLSLVQGWLDALPIVPLDECEELREALADAADAEAMRRVRDDPDEEDVPVAFARRMWNGESPVRVWREMRGMNATRLAAAANVSRSYLSAIERGTKRGSVDALKRLAAALGVGIEDLA